MSASKHFDKIAIALLCLAIAFSLVLAYFWVPVDTTGAAATISKNDLAKAKTIDLSGQNDTLYISQSGVYRLTGELKNHQVYVDVDSTERVVLILAGATVTSEDSAAIYVNNSGQLIIYTEEGTENYIISGTETEIDKSNSKANAEGGALTLKDDATLQGEGTLYVYGYLNNGIHCSNDLYIESGTWVVSGVNNGIKGKDSLTIDGGDITVLCGNAGLKSGTAGNSDTGEIVINGGTINVSQSYEGMEANRITINDGDITITASDDGINAAGGSSMFGMGGFGGGDMGGGGFKMGGRSFGDETRNRQQTEFDEELQGSMPDFENMTEEELEELKSKIEEEFGIELPDMSEMPQMPGGGFGGGERPEMPEGEMPEMPEGMDEGERPEMPEGEQPEDTERPDSTESTGSTESDDSELDLPTLTINGGTLYINAQGDGLDSNGDLIINGGMIIVDGPTGNDNGALDCGSENGGDIFVNGGTLLAIGSSGMAEVPGDSSTRNSFALAASFNAGSVITIKDANGKVLLTHTAAKSGSSIVFSSPEITIGESYIVDVDGSELTIEQTELVTQVGGSFSGMGGGFGGGMGGMSPGRGEGDSTEDSESGFGGHHGGGFGGGKGNQGGERPEKPENSGQ